MTRNLKMIKTPKETQKMVEKCMRLDWIEKKVVLPMDLQLGTWLEVEDDVDIIRTHC